MTTYQDDCSIMWSARARSMALQIDGTPLNDSLKSNLSDITNKIVSQFNIRDALMQKNAQKIQVKPRTRDERLAEAYKMANQSKPNV